MPPEMVLDMALGLECLIASWKGTGERPFSVVDSHVSIQVALFSELLVAARELALIAFLDILNYSSLSQVTYVNS